MEKQLADIGQFIRRVRKKRGLKMQDLADDNISSSTISNIEKGAVGVTDDKRIYLCKKLNLDFYELPKFLEQEENDRNQTLNTLKYVEKMIELGQTKKGLKRLGALNLSTDYLQATGKYLKGRAYVLRDDITDNDIKAKKLFEKSLQYLSSSTEFDALNLEASCYNQLAQISYYANEFHKAVEYTDLGIAAHNKKAEKRYLIYSLLMNKVVYCNKLGRYDSAAKILDDLWKQIDQINHMDVIANMHDIQAEIYIRGGMYSKAIKLAERGLETAQINKRYNRVVELLLTIGIAHMQLGNFGDAKEVFTIALDLESEVKQKYLFLPVYTQLAKIYLIEQKPDTAIELLESAINLKTKKHVDRYVETLTTLADSLIKQRDNDKAITVYNQALNVAQKHELLEQQSDILFKMCQYWDGRDKEKHYELLVNKLQIDVLLKRTNKGGEINDIR